MLTCGMQARVCQIGNVKVTGQRYQASGDVQEKPAIVKTRYKVCCKAFIFSGLTQGRRILS
jgi:ribosomal 50S subunit-recycling heat shock protein